MQSFASLKGRPRGEALLAELRAKGRPTPAVTRIRELMIGPSTAPDKQGPILRTSIEFEDGTIRAMHVDLDDIVFLMLEDDSSLVTEHWKHGDVLRNPPDPPRVSKAGAPPAARGLTVETLGTILHPLSEKISSEVSKLKRELVAQTKRADAATAKLVAADEKIASLERRASRQGEHLSRLEDKMQRLKGSA